MRSSRPASWSFLFALGSPVMLLSPLATTINMATVQAAIAEPDLRQKTKADAARRTPLHVAQCPFNQRAADKAIFDGCADAPAGPPQYPALLAAYGDKRPLWNVAGVDYHVGPPDGTTLSPWQNISGPNFEITGGNTVRCNRAGADATLNAIDFSSGTGASVYIPDGGCKSLTITNSYFACGTSSPVYFLANQNMSTVTIKYSKIDGSNCNPSVMSSLLAHVSTLQYNWLLGSPQHVLEESGGHALDYRFNLIDNMHICIGCHMNYMQWGNLPNSGFPVRIEFNTTYQTSLGGSEGFQFNAVTGSFSSVLFTHNTMIARQEKGQKTMSYMVHGSCNSALDCQATTTRISEAAINTDNYFDTSGAFGAYYGHSFNIPGARWESRNNRDMRTGREIRPD